MKTKEDEKYISTKSVKEMLKINGCTLMHLRTSKKVRFTKKGNSYLYLQDDIDKLLIED